VKRIFFSKRWPKLRHPLFTTIRLDKGSNYYRVGVHDSFEVCLGSRDKPGKILFSAQLVAVRKMRIRDITEDLAQFDAGMSKDELFLFFKRLYGNKEQWAGKDTKVLLLVFLELTRGLDDWVRRFEALDDWVRRFEAGEKIWEAVEK